MTQEEFAKWMRELVGEFEDAGLSLPEMIDVLNEQAEAMQSAYVEYAPLTDRLRPSLRSKMLSGSTANS